MSEGRLTREEAIEATHMRWLGTKVREICAKFDVDPRRLYEVWGGERFSGLEHQAFSLQRSRRL